MATQHNFRIKNGLEVGGVLIVNSDGSLAPLTDDIKLNDNVQLKFGTDNDSNIRHDGNNTKFTHTGSGGLYIGANTFGIQNGAHNENYIMAAANGAVTVYWDGSLRLSTTSTGIKVEGPSGEATMSAQNTTGFHIYTDRDRFYFNKQISLIDNTLTSYDADLVLKRVGSTKLTLLSTGVSVGGDLTVSGNLNITGDINSTSVTDLDVTDKTITVGVGQNEANSGNSGLLVAGPSTQPSLLWNESANRWAFNYGVNVAGHVIASNNVYAAGAEGFVFGSSISEGEYIKRSSNDLQFYSGGGHKFTIGTNTTLVSGNLLVPNNSSIQFGDANHSIQGGTNTGGGDMVITSSDDLYLRSRWIRFQDIAGSAGEYARIAHNGSWIYSTLTSRHIKPQTDSSYSLGEVNKRYATVFGDTGRFADLDIDNNVDIDGTLETDGLTVNNNPVYIRQQKGASNAGAGYYRVAENTVGGSGRGAFICTVYTTGGSYAPREVVIQGHTDWSSTETIHTVKSSAANTLFTKARIVRESGDAFLEVYFAQAITDIEIEVVAVGHAGWVPKNGTLTAATGTETRVGPEVLIAPGLNTQDVVNATQGFQVNNQTIVDNSRNIENITSITTEGTAASGTIIDMRPSDTNQSFRVRFPDSSTMEMGTTRMNSGNIQKAVVYGQAGVDISTNGMTRATMTQLGDFSLDADCGGLYFGGSNRSTATSAQVYIKRAGLNLDIKGNDNVRLLGDSGNIILWADYTGKVGIGTGTSAPTAKLDVKGDGADIFLQSNDFKIASIKPRGTGANLDRGLFSLFNQSTEAVHIDSDGPSWFNGANVGIGTNDAEAPLEIYKAIDGDSVGLLVMNQKTYGSGSGTNERSTIALGIAEAGTNSLDRKFGTMHVRTSSESDSSHGILSMGVRGAGAIRDDVLVLRGYSSTDQRVGIGTHEPNTELQVGDPETGNTGLTIASIYSSAAASLRFRTGHPNNTNVWDTGQIQATDDGNYNGRMTFNVSQSGMSAPATRMFIRANGRVGIGDGLFAPVERLDVRNGNIMVGGYGSGNDYGMIFTPPDGSGYWHMYNDAGGELVFGHSNTIGSTERMRIDSSGRLGIGEENPVHLVEANGTDASFIAHYDGQSRGGIAALSGQRVAFTSTSPNDDLVFGKAVNPVSSSNFTEYMRLNNGNGHLGIGGVFDADATLHVNGGAIIGGNQNKTTYPIAGLHVIDDTYSQWHQILGPRAAALRVEAYYKGNNAHERAVGDYAGGIVFNILGGHSTAHHANMHCWIGPRVWDTPGRERAALVFATNNDTGTQPSESTATILERMCITPAGLVGIGTPSPSTKLHIDQTGNTRNDGLFIERNGSTYGLNLYVDSSGYGIIGGNGGFTPDIIKLDFSQEYVGIGVNPSAKLHVRGTASNTMTTANSFAAFDGTGGDGIIIGARASSPFEAYIQSGYTPNIGTSHHYPLLLNPHGGNIGIGTTGPGATLHIADAGNNTVYSFRTNGMFSITGDGVVRWGAGGPAGGHGEMTWDTGKAFVRGQSGKALHLAGGGRANDMIIATTGKVGINGVTSPSNALSVSGVITSGNFTAVGVGGTPGDANTAEIGPGYLNLARDDTANAKQITFGKNGAVHSYLETTSSGLHIGGANVGINTSGPDYTLDVNGDVGINEYIYHNGDTNTYWRFQNDRIDIRAGGSDTITVKPTQLDINQSAKYSGFSTSGGQNRDQAVYIGRDQTDTSTEYFTMGFKTTARSGEQMHPTNGSYNGGTAFYMECGSTEAGGICLDQDSVHVYGSSDSGSTFRVIDKDSDVVTFEMKQTTWEGIFRGNVTAFGSMSSISDERIKENIEPIEPVIEKIKNVGVYKYNKITAPEAYKDRKEIGVIAQELQEEFPDLVNEETVDPEKTYGLDKILSVDYEHLTAVLLKGMQEQQEQIEELKTIINNIVENN